jgi:hypothetical protein
MKTWMSSLGEAIAVAKAKDVGERVGIVDRKPLESEYGTEADHDEEFDALMLENERQSAEASVSSYVLVHVFRKDCS